MRQYVKLPNGQVVEVSADGFVTIPVAIELSEIIDRDLEGLLDLMSDRAIGSECLSDINYELKAHDGMTLMFDVTGCIDLVEADLQHLAEGELPLQEFNVSVTRIGYGQRTATVMARTQAEAIQCADDDAGNHLYSEHTSQYEFEIQD